MSHATCTGCRCICELHAKQINAFKYLILLFQYTLSYPKENTKFLKNFHVHTIMYEMFLLTEIKKQYYFIRNVLFSYNIRYIWCERLLLHKRFKHIIMNCKCDQLSLSFFFQITEYLQSTLIREPHKGQPEWYSYSTGEKQYHNYWF